MKKWFLVLSFLWALILSWCGWSNNLVEYNDTFVTLVKECTNSTQTLFETFEAEWTTLESLSQSLQDSIDICQNSQKKALPAFYHYLIEPNSYIAIVSNTNSLYNP